MASASSSSPSATAETISQLNAARQLALQNAAYYTQIVHGVLPLVGGSAALELQRWGANFLAETTGTPVLGTEDKTKIALEVLPLLKEYLDADRQDEWVLKSTIQAAASVYPLIFRYMYVSPLPEHPTWQSNRACSPLIARERAFPNERHLHPQR